MAKKKIKLMEVFQIPKSSQLILSGKFGIFYPKMKRKKTK